MKLTDSIPSKEMNNYEQGKGQDAAAKVKPGPAYGGGISDKNPTRSGGINRATKGPGA